MVGYFGLTNQYISDFLQVRTSSNRKSGFIFFETAYQHTDLLINTVINAYGIIYMDTYMVL